MFSVNNFYDYLRYLYHCPEKNICGYYSKINGSKNFYDFVPYTEFNDLVLRKKCGSFLLFDQEPFDISAYYFDATDTNHVNHNYYAEYLSHQENFMAYFSRLSPPIICHSEKESKDINFLTQNNFLDVYYWYHGFISRDWFRNWKHYHKRDTSEITNKFKFGLYARDGSSTRSYRLDLLSRLGQISKDVYFQFQSLIKEQLVGSDIINKWPHSTIEYNSNASATIDINDMEKFHIQIVAETLFYDDRVHLTEKVFKPIVMEQPFILFGPPGSIEYIKNYGFQTFSSLWSEDYDIETNHKTRFEKLIELIKYLQSLPQSKFKKIINESKKITDFNKTYFFSEKFEQVLMSEMHNNFNLSLYKQQQAYLENPGATWFTMLETLYIRSGYLPDNIKIILTKIMSELFKTRPAVAKSILKTYPYLFNLCT